MRILLIRSVVILSAGLVICGSALAFERGMPDANLYVFRPFGTEPNQPAYQPPPPEAAKVVISAPEKLFSPSVSQLFYEMAREISLSENITDSQAEEALVLFRAAMELDVGADAAAADMLKILSRPGPPRHLQLLYDTLIKYVGKNADSQVAANAVRYLIEQLDTRRQREVLLSRLLRDIGESNPVITSELATELGLLYAERADDPNAARVLAIAYTRNRYNQLAFEKLVELVPEQISPVTTLEYFRFKLRENPLDIDAALAFAQYAQRVQLYDVAVGSYQYCADLFGFLFPTRDLPLSVYLDWMICCYNAPRGQPRCLQIADTLRKQGRFDLQIESLAAKAAAKMGDTETAANILKSAEQQATDITKADYKSLAWFYCFVRTDPEKALDWANKAYSAEPNSPQAAALLACTLVDNNQPDFAKPLVESYPQTQLASFVQARLHLAAGERQSALDSFRAAIDKAPGTLVAEQALQLLKEQQTDYIPIFDTGVILATLEQTVGEQIVPQFISPDRMLSFQLNIRGSRFTYGNDVDGTIAITNNWYEPMFISDNALCRGQITIDVEVSGDLQARIEKLVSTITRPTQAVVPGNSVLVPVRLCTGQLKELLLKHPQASLNLLFTAYLDPVVTSEGDVVSAIPGIKPATAQVERPRVEINTDFLQNRLGSLTKGRQGPKITAIRLFAGLLMENLEMANHQLPYKLAGTDRMTPVLKSAMAQGLTDGDWVIEVHSMAAIAPLPLDYVIISAAAKGLNDQHWPARMMAVSLLAQKQGDSFAKVLDHTAQYDDSPFVRGMAVALGAKVSEPNQPLEQPFLDLLRQEPGPNEPNL
jgi:tetratricopeptide (TPR) repeat protein